MSAPKGKTAAPNPIAGEATRTLALRLRELRKSLGLSHEQFGAQLAVAKNTAWRYEQEGYEVPHGFLVAVCTVFDVDPRWLLLGVGNPQAHHAARESVDLQMLEEVVRGAESVLTAERLTLPPDKRGQLMVALYELVRDERRRDANAKIDLGRFSNVIRLAK